MKHTTQLFLVTWSCLSITACSSSKLIPFSMIHQSNQCKTQTAAITSLSTLEEQTRFLSRYSMFKAPEVKSDLIKLFEEHTKHETIFLVSQGQQPSSGYGFNITSNQATLRDNQLTVPIFFKKPKNGAISAQVITSPCIIFGVDSRVHFDSIKVDTIELTLNK